MIIYAAVLIALMVLRPEGLLGERELSAHTIATWFRRRLARGKDPA
jgi:hypothetical protein